MASSGASPQLPQLQYKGPPSDIAKPDGIGTCLQPCQRLLQEQKPIHRETFFIQIIQEHIMIFGVLLRSAEMLYAIVSAYASMPKH